MRIFSYQPYPDPFGIGMDPALEEMGHTVFPFREEILKENTNMNKSLINAVKKIHEKKKIDLFICATDLRFTYPESIEKIKKMGIPTLNFAHDDIPEQYFDLRCKDLALQFDYNWTCQRSSFDFYKKIGVDCIYVPAGANPDLFKPYDVKREFDVTFTGVNKHYRKKTLEMIDAEGIDTHAWGLDWTNMKGRIRLIHYLLDEVRHSDSKILDFFRLSLSEGLWFLNHYSKEKKIFNSFLSHDEMVKIFSRSKISLNFAGYDSIYNKYIDKSDKGLKGRDFEAPMSGAFYLTDHSDELASLYKVGKEIVTFSNIPELIDKIKYYLENYDEAEAVREAGRKKALECYTWKVCLEKVFEQMNF